MIEPMVDAIMGGNKPSAGKVEAAVAEMLSDAFKYQRNKIKLELEVSVEEGAALMQFLKDLRERKG